MAEFSPKLKEALSLVQKPGRYTGGEPGCTYKDKANVDVRMAFCFPDTYEIGMSFLGEKILYELLNRHENWWCERAFMPWVDMKEQMERLHIPLYCLESKDPLTDFDIVGFSLEYELCYTNILAMLDLAGIPLRAADRDERWPLIISGGPCVCNAEPMADFFDIMQLGEGEQMLQDICATVEAGKKAGWNKDQLLFELSKIPGVYVPSFYDVTYLPDGRWRCRSAPRCPGTAPPESADPGGQTGIADGHRSFHPRRGAADGHNCHSSHDSGLCAPPRLRQHKPVYPAQRKDPHRYGTPVFCPARDQCGFRKRRFQQQVCPAEDIGA